MHTVRIRTAKTPEARLSVTAFWGKPTRRFAPPTSASPELHTEMEKKANAVRSERKDPTTRPCTPRCPDDETALFIPLVGPKTAIGQRIRPPTTTPRTVASSASLKDSPKRMGN